MRNVILIVLLCLAGMAYGQSELREIRTGDMFLYTSDSSSPVAFTYSYPKSFRVVKGKETRIATVFYRNNTPLANLIWMRRKSEKRADSSLLYSDTTTVRHYHTSWRNAAHDRTEDTVTINGRVWKTIEFAVEAEMKNGKTMYDKERIYTITVDDWVVSVVYVISVTSDAQQAAKLFDEYKDVFRTEMETFEFATGEK